MSNKYDDIIPLVRKPSRYLGREINSVQKDPARVKIRFALVFPDMYEIGMSNLGLKILYHLLNQKEEIWAERAFLPAPDFESLMRSRGISLSSLESRTSLREFDIVGISIPHELNLSGILNVLDLSGIPLRAEDRQEGFPLILGGGGGVFNPEPVAPFFDAILIGDGEEAVLKIVDRFQRHRGARRGKGELLQSLAEVEGVYVPSFHPRTAGSLMVKRTIAKDLDRLPFPSSPIVPFLDIVHNRIVVEIARGCTVGCRFCQAGMVYRPVRERSVENICRLVRENLDATGYEEATFLSLSASDYSQLSPLLSALNRELQNRTLAFSLPSLRVRPLKPEILAELSRVKRGGITLAPEAGTERLRRSLNKPASDEEIVESVARVFQAGWPAVKLYFMVGLPGEGPEDLEGIASLVRLIKREAAPRGSGKTIRVSVGGFIPKAHTPFQWERMASLRELEEARGLLREALPRGGVEFKFHNPRFSLLEGILARGDRSLADVIQGAFARGARFDSWKEYFRWEIWEEAFRETGLDFEQHLGPFDIDSPLPWNHIDCGPSREFLEQERERSRAGETTDPCGRSGCSECGLCGAGRSSNEEVSPRLAPAPRGSPVSGEVWGRSARGSGNERKVWISRYRVRFEKTGPARFLSQLELQQVFIRVVRRSRIPIRYSEGFHPLPALAFGPALPVGMEGKSLFADMELKGVWETGELEAALNRYFPDGVRAIEVREIPRKSPSIFSQITSAVYEVDLSRRPELAKRIRSRVDRPEREKSGTSGGVAIIPLDHEKIKLIIPFSSGRGEKPNRVLAEYGGVDEGEIKDLSFVCTQFELSG